MQFSEIGMHVYAWMSMYAWDQTLRAKTVVVISFYLDIEKTGG